MVTSRCLTACLTTKQNASPDFDGLWICLHSPLGAGECQVALCGLVGGDGNGWAHSTDSAGAPGHIAKANACDVAEVKEHCWVALVEHLEPAITTISLC